MKMRKRLLGPRLLRKATVLCGALSFGAAALGQGTITFNTSAGLSSTYYEELGMWFQVVVPLGTSGYDDIGIVPGNLYHNLPTTSTPFMFFLRQNNPFDYVALSMTNGSMFGLTSVQLADPNSPSPSPVSISFVGHLASGLAITNTFTTPGNGATTFATYAFNSDFTSGLTSVDILAPRWAMDDLTFTVPEPGIGSLSLLGLLALGWLAARRRDS